MRVVSKITLICKKLGQVLLLSIFLFGIAHAHTDFYCENGAALIRSVEELNPALSEQILAQFPYSGDKLMLSSHIDSTGWHSFFENNHKTICAKLNKVDGLQQTFFATVEPAISNVQKYQRTPPYMLRGRFEVEADVPMPSKRIRQGDVIEASDLHYVQMVIKPYREAYLLKLNDLVGMAARRALLPNRGIREKDVGLPDVIKKNDTVNIVFENENLSLKATGVALESGAVGSRIKVKNARSKNVVYALIKDRDTVYASN